MAEDADDIANEFLRTIRDDLGIEIPDIPDERLSSRSPRETNTSLEKKRQGFKQRDKTASLTLPHLPEFKQAGAASSTADE